MKINLCTIDWAAISAIASFAMIFITWITLRQNKKQLLELKHQWDEQNRAKLNISIVVKNQYYMLKIANIGNQNAHNIKIEFNDEFVDALLGEEKKKVFKAIQSKCFSIEAGVSRYIPISLHKTEGVKIRSGSENFTSEDVNKWLEDNMSKNISIIGSYCNKYYIDEKFSISDFMGNGFAEVKDDITMTIQNIQKGLTSPDLLTPIPTIQKSLKILNDNMNKIINKLEDNNIN